MEIKKDYPEELTVKMHSEFTISKEREKYLRAGCVWEAVECRKLTSQSDIEKECKGYGISYEGALKHKDKWMKLIKHSPKL